MTNFLVCAALAIFVIYDCRAFCKIGLGGPFKIFIFMDMINGPLSYTNMGYVKQPNCLLPIMHYVSARISFRSNLLLSSTYLRNQSLIILHGFFYLSKYMQIYNYF